MTSDQNEEMRVRFTDLWRRIESRSSAAPVWDRLLSAYTEPHRHYHTLEHIKHMLDLFDETRGTLGLDSLSADGLEAAIWFHDVVYQTVSPGQRMAISNEELSAAWAALTLREAGQSRIFCAIMADLIRFTNYERDPAGPLREWEEVLWDLDLSILGAGPEKFAAYEEGVRQEYCPTPAHLNEYRKGRALFLRSFVLSRDWIYHTDCFRENFEGPAKMNVRKLVHKLEGQLDPVRAER